VKLSELCFY